jgi:curved DNA-binding protein CbpA
MKRMSGELTPGQKARIDALHTRSKSADLYEVLGIARGIDKKAVKKAYFELTQIAHPDRYFGKDLGEYRQKLNYIFARITEAHDTLTNAAKRSDYDALMRGQRISGVQIMIEELAREMAGTSGEHERVELDSERITIDESSKSDPPSRVASTPPPPTAAELDARRKALAARLRRR